MRIIVNVMHTPIEELRRLIRTEVRALSEAASGTRASLPSAVSSIVSSLPGLKVTKTPQGWTGKVRIGEKRASEQNAFERAWERLKIKLTKPPWRAGRAERTGYNAQTDTGGNFSANSSVYTHETGATVALKRSVSFSSGTKEWYVSITDA